MTSDLISILWFSFLYIKFRMHPLFKRLTWSLRKRTYVWKISWINNFVDVCQVESIFPFFSGITIKWNRTSERRDILPWENIGLLCSLLSEEPDNVVRPYLALLHHCGRICLAGMFSSFVHSGSNQAWRIYGFVCSFCATRNAEKVIILNFFSDLIEITKNSFAWLSKTKQDCGTKLHLNVSVWPSDST